MQVFLQILLHVPAIELILMGSNTTPLMTGIGSDVQSAFVITMACIEKSNRNRIRYTKTQPILACWHIAAEQQLHNYRRINVPTYALYGGPSPQTSSRLVHARLEGDRETADGAQAALYDEWISHC